MFYDLFFDKEFATVNRLIKDSHPYSIVKGEGKDTIIINALGVAQEDIKVEIKPVDDRAYLYIQGETKNSITNTNAPSKSPPSTQKNCPKSRTPPIIFSFSFISGGIL